MLVSHLKHEAPYEESAQVSLGFLKFGENNVYPQSILKILSGSPTASSCVDVYKHFLVGDGFEDERLNDLKVNLYGDTLLDILKKVCSDYATFGGFALHVYDQDLIHVPFEFVRIGIPDQDFNVNYYAIYDDWAREKINEKHPYVGYSITQDLIQYVPTFSTNERINLEQRRATEGSYRGQLYYWKNQNIAQYPLPIYYSALTDMSTEAGLINLSYRNARMNFFPAGIISRVDAESKNAREMEMNAKEVMDALKQFQGDTNAGKIMYMPTDDPNNIPQFIPFQTQNIEQFFTATTDTVRERIGRIFNQPPILRSEDVGSNFGADAIGNAYQFYNSICETHRNNIMGALNAINSFIKIVNTEIVVLPPRYIDKEDIRKFKEEEILSVMTLLQSDLNPDQKKQMLILGYGLEQAEAEELVDREAMKKEEAKKFTDDEIGNLLSILQSANLNPDQQKQILIYSYGLEDAEAESLIDREAYEQAQQEHEELHAQRVGGFDANQDDGQTDNDQASNQTNNFIKGDKQKVQDNTTPQEEEQQDREQEKIDGKEKDEVGTKASKKRDVERSDKKAK